VRVEVLGSRPNQRAWQRSSEGGADYEEKGKESASPKCSGGVEFLYLGEESGGEFRISRTARGQTCFKLKK